ncbi:MAG: PIN domain-containing protein [Nitrococcus sp.]|nr:PIN domain-containing protein [Nitrococcus sp.]
MYLLDTNILSAAAPTKKVHSIELIDWMDRASQFLFLSVITAAEVEDGIAKNAREGATRKAAALREWWEAVEHLYSSRILPLDVGAARIAGRLMDKARSRGFEPGFADVAIAAIAAANGLLVLSRNVRHFEAMGVTVLNPYDALPCIPA